MKKAINTDRAPSPVGPYSQAIKTDSLVFVSGQIALDPKTGKMDNENVEVETHRVINNIRLVLEAANLDLDQVVKCSIFVTDISQYALINEVYSEYFSGPQPPARELVEVSRLPKGASVEISAIAAINN